MLVQQQERRPSGHQSSTPTSPGRSTSRSVRSPVARSQMPGRCRPPRSWTMARRWSPATGDHAAARRPSPGPSHRSATVSAVAGRAPGARSACCRRARRARGASSDSSRDRPATPMVLGVVVDAPGRAAVHRDEDVEVRSSLPVPTATTESPTAMPVVHAVGHTGEERLAALPSSSVASNGRTTQRAVSSPRRVLEPDDARPVGRRQVGAIDVLVARQDRRWGRRSLVAGCPADRSHACTCHDPLSLVATVEPVGSVARPTWGRSRSGARKRSSQRASWVGRTRRRFSQKAEGIGYAGGGG